MALVLADRVKETTTTTGTATYTLAGASTGFESFASIGDGNTTYYACTDGTDFEVGIGTYTASGTTLARTTILQSSNSDSAVSWSSGTKTIFCCQPAEKAVFRDASGHIIALDGRNLTNVDATTLDSLDSTQFLRSDAADTKTSGDLTFNDDVKAVFGAGSDLQIYHETTFNNSIIKESGSGNLVIGGDQILLRNSALTELKAYFSTNGAVELYHDNSKKLETSSTGATVTGNLVTTSGVAINNASGYGNIEIGGTSGAFVDLKNPNSDDYDIRLITTGTGGQFLSQDALRIGSMGTTSITNVVGNSTYANFIPGGAVELYHDNSKKLETTSTGAEITGDLTLTSTADNGAVLKLVSNDPSDVVDFGIEGQIQFFAENDASESVQYYGMQLRTSDVTDGTEDGWLYFTSISNGTLTNANALGNDGTFYFLGNGNAPNAVIKWFQTKGTSYSVSLAVATPTADRTITLPDASGTVLLKDANDDVVIEGTDAGSGADPTLVLYRNSASPAAFDNLGKIEFKGKNSSGADHTYFYMQAQASDETAGSEDGVLNFYHTIGGNENRLIAGMGYSALTAYGQLKINSSTTYSDPSLVFEGATANSFETSVKVVDPTADRTITLPDATGTLPVFTTAPTGAIADGTNGQVLTTNGSGTLSFTTVSGGGSTPVYFDAYKSGATQTFTDATITVDFNTARQNSDATIFSNSSGEITVNDTGVYKIEYSVVVGINFYVSRSEGRLVLEKKPSGGSFAEVDGTVSISYNRQDPQDSTTSSISIMQSVTSGDTYRVRVSRNNGTSTLKVATDQARFNFLKID